MPRRPPKRPALPEQLVTHPAQLAACVEHLAQAPLIGFDTEFVGEDAYRPELCLVQVSSADALYVIDPFSCGSLAAFWELLHDPNRVTVVHAGREDVRLCLFESGKPPANVFDVQIAAGLVGMTYPIGYAGLVHDLLRQRMQKGETLTDWRKRPLTPAQVRYAYDDVRYLLPAHKKLTDRLTKRKRLDWAREEFAAAVKKAVTSDANVERWRKVKGIGALDRRGLAVAREVYGWRDKFAERINRPPRFVVRDDLLIEIARRAPTRAEDLQSLRGIPRNQEEAILEAVRRAKALPPNECPEPETRDSEPPNVVLLANLLSVVLNDFCGRHKLASNLVASGADLKAVVRSRAFDEPLADIPLSRGWRSRAVLPELMALLTGETAIRVADPKSLDPLELVELEDDDDEADEGDEGGDELEPVPPAADSDATLSEDRSAAAPPEPR
jgi:ribonuclease D